MKRLRLIRPSHGFSFYDVEPEQGGIVVAVESSSTDPTAPTRYQIWLHGLRRLALPHRDGRRRASTLRSVCGGGHRFAVPVGRGFKVVDLDSGRSSVTGSVWRQPPHSRSLPTARHSSSRHSHRRGFRRAGGPTTPSRRPTSAIRARCTGSASTPPGTARLLAAADGRLITWDLTGRTACRHSATLGTGTAGNMALPPAVSRRLRARSAGRRRSRRRHRADARRDKTGHAGRSIDRSRRTGQAWTADLSGTRPCRKDSLARHGRRPDHELEAATGKRLYTRSLPPRGGHPPSIVAVALSRTGLLAAAADDGRVARFSQSSNYALPEIDVAGANNAQVALALDNVLPRRRQARHRVQRWPRWNDRGL